MPHYIQLFFEQLGGEFTFISYEEVLGKFWDQTLPPLLANCVASMASRFVVLPYPPSPMFQGLTKLHRLGILIFQS